MTIQKYITKEELNELPQFIFTGEIILISTTEDARKALIALKDEKVLGFDTETRPAFTKGESYPPALLQLGTRDKAYLFRLQDFAWPEELIQLLENENVLKVGVAIKDDAKALHKMMNFVPMGFVDVSYEARIRKFESEGLRALTGIFLGKRLSKASKITNWDRKNLTEAQLLYAATDAVVSLLVYEEIVKIPV
jgi:ribonuclease D